MATSMDPPDQLSPALGRSDRPPEILIVDDSLTVRMDLQEILESAEFSSFACETLAAARTALKEHAFSLIILDVLLPDGDGIQLLKEVRGGPNPAIPVMLLSTEAEVSDRIRGMKTGADDYIGKPYDPAYVLVRIRQFLAHVSQAADAGRARILVIDDSATFRETFKIELEAAGYGVLTAASGEEGLKTAAAQFPDAIIVDRVLSAGIDGDDVIRRLKQDVRLRSVPCLLLTGSEQSGEELRALDAGADAYLRKDTDMGITLARLGALLRSSGAGADVTSGSSLFGATKILAVDDSRTFLHELSDQLKEEGYDAILAESGKEALALLEYQTVDCILLDVKMPEMSGNEVCRRIKADHTLRNIPLLMLTALDEPEAVIEGINCGADDYISKSSDFTVLKARVRAQLRRKQFEDEYRGIREALLQKELEAAQARAAQQIAEARAALVDQLEQKNRELEAFAAAASHDLRAPLRAIRGFSQAVIDDCGAELPPQAHAHIERVQNAAVRMGKLVDALLELSRTSRADLRRETIDLTKLARSIVSDLAESDRQRQVEWRIADHLEAYADPALVRVALNNLFSNAWKFTSKMPKARIEMGVVQKEGREVFFVSDNGVGFDNARANRLFEPFERLHTGGEFPGLGVGLATVHRIIERHDGEIRAESKVGEGATFYFAFGRVSAPEVDSGISKRFSTPKS